VKNSTLLTTTSLLAALLFTIHVADDVVRGFDRAGPQNGIGMAFLVLWLYAALVLVERKSGLIITMLFGLLSAVMPMAHLTGRTVLTREFAQSPGALFFFWTLWGIAALGGLSVVLAVRGLLALRKQPSAA
jgi:hypothetical protein